MNTALIIGAGSYGQTFKYYLEEAGYKILGFIDDNPALTGTYIEQIPVLGNFEALINQPERFQQHCIFCPIGNNEIRTVYLSKLRSMGFTTPNFIHQSVIIPRDLNLGLGNYFLPGVKLMPYTRLGDYCIISMGSHIAHHTVLETGVFISTGVNIGANITIDQNAFIGIGATVMTGVSRLGQYCIIGSGTVVIKDVDPFHVVAGVPGKTIKINTSLSSLVAIK